MTGRYTGLTGKYRAATQGAKGNTVTEERQVGRQQRTRQWRGAGWEQRQTTRAYL